MQCELFVYQKTVDLHAVSAYEALTRYLNMTDCLHITRFKHWCVSLETPSMEPQEVANVLATPPCTVLNPTKEGYLLSLDACRVTQGISVFVDVFDKDGADRPDMKQQLFQQTGLNIIAVREHVTWQCTIDALSIDAAKQRVTDVLLPTGTTPGILANPIYESFQFIT